VPLTPGYDPTPLAPKVTIQNLAGANQYTFETSVTNASPVRDFYLRTLSMDLGVGDDWGNAVLLIDDPQNTLTENDSRKACKIRRQWNIQIELGKSPTTKNRWFYGKILEASVIRPGTNLQQIRLICIGWGIRLVDRVTKIKRFQAKQADGIALDSTDTNARISEIAKDIIADRDHYPDLGQSQEADITTTQVDTIDIKLADFQQNYQSFASALSQLAAGSGAIMTIDADRDLIFRIPGNSNSEFLFTNNLSGLDAQGWNANKIGYLFKAPFDWTDSTFESGISNLIGINASIINKDLEFSSANATRSLHLSYLAIPITHTLDNIAKIAPSVAKTGTPADKADFRIIGKDGSNLPNTLDLRKQTYLAKEIIQGFSSGSGTYKEISFEEEEISPRESLFFYIGKYGTSSNTFVIDYQTGSGTYYTSADAVSWASNTGTMKLRTYGANPAQVIVENSVAKNRFGLREKVIPFRQKMQQEAVQEVLTGLAEVLGKERRIYSDIVVSVPTDRIPLGKTCRIQDSFSGLDITGEIIGVKISMTADDATTIGANKMILKLMEFK